ncbi:hypothetical protein EVJ58_g10764 [Rhodofomes roseus]|uniref:CxC1-like cysteine cluster associated with KDZ transposases domain-containing protein n=1 Tax=Rhodofomes roseus TaxID=34475 RepID=A0A4Y9XMS6_9APHY|nr:hypothetical protein EVJ58_g10764 [Rhodofomes roseus]
MGRAKTGRKIRCRVGHGGGSKYVNITGIAQADERAAEHVALHEAWMSVQDRQALTEARGQASSAQGTTDDNPDVTMDGPGGVEDGQWVDEEEGAEVIAIRDLLNWRYKGRHQDTRTWRNRVEQLQANWKAVFPQLVEGYLQWRYPRQSTSPPGPGNDDTDADAPDTPACDLSIQMWVFDVYTLVPEATISRPSINMSVAEALVRGGYLGTTPVNPSIAISLRSLELLRCLRLFKASYSMESYAKLLCYYYKIPYRRYYRALIADAFEVYLSVLQEVRRRLDVALGRDGPNWRVKNACPACSYKLNDEPELRWARMVCVDGNNSLKRIAGIGNRQQGDSRVFSRSGYYLPRELVEEYSNEVQSRGRTQTDDDDADAQPETVSPDAEGDPTDGGPEDEDIAICTQNWKAAQESKSMWGVFEETGVFASACRHGLVLWLVDMVRSGELAKYPLAMISKMLSTFDDGKILCHYDIGCSFEGTIRHSRLGPRWIATRSRCGPNAFHGYTHNAKCQIRNHPNVVEGTGLEDGETLERIFSASNGLASITRYASPYRRRMLIHEFFQQWDDEKYANLSTMIYNNYIQALDIIDINTLAVEEGMRSLKVGPAELASWYEEESSFMESLGKEQPWDTHAVVYVEKLNEWRLARARSASVMSEFMSSLPPDYTYTAPGSEGIDYGQEASRTRKLETKRRYAEDRERSLSVQLADMEVKMGIERRWDVTDREYVEMMQYIDERRFHQALNNLQRLVVQRLFELHKLNLSQTGYRLRTHMAKSLQTRCKAIQNALKAYNTAAQALKPPRPQLDWTTVSNYNFIEEFALLQDTRDGEDVRRKPWAQPLAREVMKQAKRIERAREEVVRCNVEARRLYTHVLDEDALFTRVLQELQRKDDALYGAVEDFCTRRRHINNQHLSRLQQLSKVKGFNGNVTRGVRLGSVLAGLSDGSPGVPASSTPPPLMSALPAELAAGEDEQAFDEEDDGVEQVVGAYVEYVSNLSR